MNCAHGLQVKNPGSRSNVGGASPCVGGTFLKVYLGLSKTHIPGKQNSPYKFHKHPRIKIVILECSES